MLNAWCGDHRHTGDVAVGETEEEEGEEEEGGAGVGEGQGTEGRRGEGGGEGPLHLTYKYSMKKTYKFVLEQT